MIQPKDSNRLALGGGLLAAILASLCCVGPLVLLMIGVSGAWIANLRVFSSYKYLLMGITIILLAWAYRGVFLQPEEEACQEGQICARPAAKRIYKISFWVILTLSAILFLTPLISPLFY